MQILVQISIRSYHNYAMDIIHDTIPTIIMYFSQDYLR